MEIVLSVLCLSLPAIEERSEPDALRVETLAKWGPDRRFGVDVQQLDVDRFAPDPEFEVKVRGLVSGLRLADRDDGPKRIAWNDSTGHVDLPGERPSQSSRQTPAGPRAQAGTPRPN